METKELYNLNQLIKIIVRDKTHIDYYHFVEKEIKTNFWGKSKTVDGYWYGKYKVDWNGWDGFYKKITNQFVTRNKEN